MKILVLLILVNILGCPQQICYILASWRTCLCWGGWHLKHTATVIISPVLSTPSPERWCGKQKRTGTEWGKGSGGYTNFRHFLDFSLCWVHPDYEPILYFLIKILVGLSHPCLTFPGGLLTQFLGCLRVCCVGQISDLVHPVLANEGRAIGTKQDDWEVACQKEMDYWTLSNPCAQ